jgi:hypothetical protein
MDDTTGETNAAMGLGSNPAAQSHLLQRVHGAVLGGERAPGSPRSVVSESWQRSLAAHVDPEGQRPPVVYEADEVGDVRSAHPLRALVPLLRSMLVEIADASQHIMIVTDADGTILWREGAAEVCLRADPVGLCEGARWAEDAIGTNAMGTALVVDAPVQIFSAEHLVRAYQTWTCAAVPIHDPDTGVVLGAIDVSGHLQTLHPAVVTLVTATAQLAEGHLRMQMALRDERLRTKNMPHLTALRGEPGALLTPTGRVLATEPQGLWPERIALRPGEDRVLLADGREGLLEPLPEGYLIRVPRAAPAATHRPMLSLSFLRDRPVAVLDGRELPLTLWRTELLTLLTLLALHPPGLTAEQLALQLYGDEGNPTTVRAEIHRLRGQFGHAAMRTKPYRLRAEVDADFLTARAALRSGDVPAALAACQAPLLTRSEAPAIRAERDQLAAALRRAVLEHRDLDALWTYGQREPGRDDLEVFEHLVRELPPHDPRHPVAAARLQWLLSDQA